MCPEQEDFEELRRLLALKRHEQPPPGYFHDFSRQVIARIKAGEAGANESFLGRLVGHAPWLRNLWDGFEGKPILAGAFGVGVCSLLVFGLVSSERSDSDVSNGGVPQALFAKVPGQTVGTTLFERASAESGAANTNLTRYSIFDEIQRPHVQPMSFSTPAAN
jgi:hypothetical protein